MYLLAGWRMSAMSERCKHGYREASWCGDCLREAMSAPREVSGEAAPTSNSMLYTFNPPQGECPKHGLVDIFTVYGHSRNVEYARLNCCPKCYIEWIAANVTQVTPVAGSPDANREENVNNG